MEKENEEAGWEKQKRKASPKGKVNSQSEIPLENRYCNLKEELEIAEATKTKKRTKSKSSDEGKKEKVKQKTIQKGKQEREKKLTKQTKKKKIKKITASKRKTAIYGSGWTK